jgi:hypothetical protein
MGQMITIGILEDNFRVHFFSQGTYQLAVDSCGLKRFARPRSKKTNIPPSFGQMLGEDMGKLSQ